MSDKKIKIEETKTTSFFVQDVPADLKRAYKAVITRKGVTIKDDLIRYMEETVKKGGGK